MRWSSDSPLERIMRTNSCCSESRPVSSRSEVVPMMPFIGVRISWLMLARKSALASRPAWRAFLRGLRLLDHGLALALVFLDLIHRLVEEVRGAEISSDPRSGQAVGPLACAEGTDAVREDPEPPGDAAAEEEEAAVRRG